MKAYIHVSDGFVAEVEVKTNPNYKNEIIIGGQRLTLFGGGKRLVLSDVQAKDISVITIFPGVKTWARVKTKDTTLIGIVQKSNLGMILPLTSE